jgi:UDP-N-acetylglucosamine 2-epimerase (non-hydrolysing)
MYSPWPEEINRQLTARIASIHFAPTPLNVQNLIQENINSKSIFKVGNTVIDALLLSLNKININDKLKKLITQELYKMNLPKEIFTKTNKIILVTIHRRENFGIGILNICKVLERLLNENSNLKIILPLHPNPNVRIIISNYFNNIKPKNLFLVEPLDYLPFIFLMNKSYFIMTDSGGVQEEAPSLGKPVLVLRNTTERIEALSSKNVILVGTNIKKVYDNANKLLTNKSFYNSFKRKKNPYGNGDTSNKIVKILLNKYKLVK